METKITPRPRSGQALFEGIVVENHGALFDVQVKARTCPPAVRRTIKCVLRGKLKKDEHRAFAPIAAGDRVEVRLLEPGRGVIERVYPRSSDLSRTAAGAEPLQQTLAANVDQVVIVFATAEPRTDFFMLDRFLVVGTAANLDPLICINKCDLVAPSFLRAEYELYQHIGFRLIYMSAKGGAGLAELRGALKDRRSVIAGPSGVGKSSLLNAVAPGLALRTGAIGEVTHKGRHTTTSTSLLELPFGGWVADTPGLRQLNFWEAIPEQITAAFPDLHPYLGKCRFTNCTHKNEEGCALNYAVEKGRISKRRLRSYLEMGGR